MAIKVDVKVQGLDRVVFGIDRMGQRAHDLRPVFRVIAGKLRDHYRKQFETAGRTGGQAWRGRPDLERSGSLRSSFEDKLNRSHYEVVGKGTLEIGSKHPLARIHQRSRGRARIQKKTGRFTGVLPRRRIAAFRKREEEPVIENPVVRYIVDGRV